MRGIKILFGTTALLAGLALAPAAQSQVYLSIGVQPVCSTAITITPHTPARLTAITGQGTSTTASSSGWAHGPVGATVTAGADIASAKAAEETITAAAAKQPIAAVLHTVAAAEPVEQHGGARSSGTHQASAASAPASHAAPAHTQRRLRTSARFARRSWRRVARGGGGESHGGGGGRTVAAADMKADINL